MEVAYKQQREVLERELGERQERSGMLARGARRGRRPAVQQGRGQLTGGGGSLLLPPLPPQTPAPGNSVRRHGAGIYVRTCIPVSLNGI